MSTRVPHGATKLAGTAPICRGAVWFSPWHHVRATDAAGTAQVIALVDGASLAVYGRDGVQRWRRAVPGATRVAISASGERLVVCSDTHCHEYLVRGAHRLRTVAIAPGPLATIAIATGPLAAVAVSDKGTIAVLTKSGLETIAPNGARRTVSKDANVSCPTFGGEHLYWTAGALSTRVHCASGGTWGPYTGPLSLAATDKVLAIGVPERDTVIVLEEKRDRNVKRLGERFGTDVAIVGGKLYGLSPYGDNPRDSTVTPCT